MKHSPSAGPVFRLLFFALLSVFALQSCASAPPLPPAPAELRIVIFHSNDVHAKIDNFAKVAAIIDAERKAGAADVFFFSAGDNFSGDPVTDLYDPPGEPMFELLGRMGLDLLTPGNHEFDYGLGALRRFAARFRTISANIEPLGSVFPELQPYVVLTTKAGIKIVVFGVIQIEPDNRIPSTHPDKVKGLRFSEPVAKALEMKKLRSLGQVLIGLTHIGHQQDLLLANQMPELDVIIGGHSHTRVDPAETINGVLVAQAGSDGAFLGRVDLLLKNGRIVEKKGRLIDLSQARDEDPAIKAMIAKFRQNPALRRVIAKAPIEIIGKNALGNLMTDAIRHVHGLDIAFQNNGGIRLNRLPMDITLNDVYTLEPFGNEVVQFTMTPAEIRSLIKTSWEKRFEIDLQVSGITYLIRVDSAKQVKDIRLANMDGSPLPEEKTYSVGLSSYIASSYKFTHKDPGRSLQATVNEDLIRYLQSGVDLSVYRDVKRASWEIAPGSSRH